MADFQDVKRFLLSSSATRNFWWFLYLFVTFIGCVFLAETNYLKSMGKKGGRFSLTSFAIVQVLPIMANALRGTKLTKWKPSYLGKTVGYACCLAFTLFPQYFKEKSEACVVVHMAVVVAGLVLLQMIRPFTDLGFFNLLISMVMSVTYNLHGRSFVTWVTFSLCVLLSLLKNWLDEADVEERPRDQAV